MTPGAALLHYKRPGQSVAVCGDGAAIGFTTLWSLTACPDCIGWLTKHEPSNHLDLSKALAGFTRTAPSTWRRGHDRLTLDGDSFVLTRRGQRLGSAPSLRSLLVLLDLTRNTRAVSLVELAVVIAALALLAVVAAPVVGTALTDLRVRSEVRALWGTLHHCRSTAIASAAAVTATLSPTGLACSSGATWAPTDGGWTVPAVTFAFNGMGAVVPPLGPLTLATPAGPVGLTITPAGTPRITGP